MRIKHPLISIIENATEMTWQYKSNNSEIIDYFKKQFYEYCLENEIYEMPKELINESIKVNHFSLGVINYPQKPESVKAIKFFFKL